MIARPALYAVTSGFLVGVAARSLFPLGESSAAFFLSLGIALALVSLLAPLRREALVASFALVFAALGIVRTDAALPLPDPVLFASLGKVVSLEGDVVAEPDVRENSVRLYVHADGLMRARSTEALSAGVLIAAPAHSQVSYGDRIVAEGKLALPKPFETNGGREFDYPGYLAKDGILYTLSFAKVSVVGHGGNPLTASAIALKQKYLDGLHRALVEPEAGLAGGITVGDKRGVGQELSDVFRVAGLVHIVVLSGYNITLVMNAVRYTLARLPLPVQYGALSFAVIFFILMTGGAASAVRAGAMALIAVFARASGRQFIAVRALAVVCAGMVVWNPLILVYDPSFQLSALATLGLISFTPLFSQHLGWMPERFGLREIAASTLATQMMVLPLLLWENGQFSLVALPVNLLALVAVSPAMFASFVAALAGLVPPLAGLAPLVALPAYALLWYVIFIAEFFAALPFAAVSVPFFSAWWLLVVYGGMVSFALKYERTRNGKEVESGPS